VYAPEEPAQVRQLRVHRVGEHVGVEQAGDGAAGGVARDEQRGRGAVGVLAEEAPQALRDGVHHPARDGQEAGVAEVARVVEEALRGGRLRVDVDGPVAEALGAADGEDDGVHVVDGDGPDDHGLGAGAPVGVDVEGSFSAGGRVIHAAGVLRGEAEEGVCGEVTAWITSAPVSPHMLRQHACVFAYTLNGGRSGGNREFA